jgi:hypothetical protein
MKTNLVIMLTHNDKTVKNAIEVFQSCKDLSINNWGFIAPQHLTVEKFLDKLSLSLRHYYRIRQQAITIISFRLWSTPAAELDSWLELLSLFEIL